MRDHLEENSEIDLGGYRNRKDVIERVAKQIEKDLLLDKSIELSENPNNAYRELFSHLLPLISSMRLNNHQQFLNALYRIDISEKKMNLAFQEESFANAEETICRLIIERELIKVVYRLIYSKQIPE